MRWPTTEGCGHLHDGRAKRCRDCNHARRRAMATDRDALAARFWKKVDRSGPVPSNDPTLGPCWIWRASLDVNGYGQFQMLRNGRATMAKAHRVGYELEHGIQPTGVSFCHRCNNPPCVRVSHVYIGDDQTNALDRVRAGTAAKKLNPDAVSDIRRALAAGETGRSIAARHSIAPSLVSAIKGGKVWA